MLFLSFGSKGVITITITLGEGKKNKGENRCTDVDIFEIKKLKISIHFVPLPTYLQP